MMIVNDGVDELICNECGRRVGLWNYSGTLSEVCDVRIYLEDDDDDE